MLLCSCDVFPALINSLCLLIHICLGTSLEHTRSALKKKDQQRKYNLTGKKKSKQQQTHTRTHARARTHTRTHARTHARTRARAHTHTHTHTHSHTHTHTHQNKATKQNKHKQKTHALETAVTESFELCVQVFGMIGVLLLCCAVKERRWSTNA